MGVVAEVVRSHSYPVHILEGAESGLCLFAAAFLGENDAVHFWDAGIRTTCVDIDHRRLETMSALYPDDWEFFAEDAWTFADRNSVLGRQWDVVSVDTFTGDAEQRSLKSLPLWCALARKALTVTLCPGSMYRVPEGFRAWHFRRSSRALWLVLIRD